MTLPSVRLVPLPDGWYRCSTSGRWHVLGSAVRDVLSTRRRRWNSSPSETGWEIRLRDAFDRRAFALALARFGWTLDGFPAPPPASNPRLYAHQREGVLWLLSRDQALLCDEPGLGKTAQAVEALRLLGGEAVRVLVLCPAGLCRHWAREIARWAGVEAVVLRTDPGRKLGAGWYVASYDLAKRRTRLTERIVDVTWDVLVLDEAHSLRSALSARSELVDSLAARRVWALTASPVWNRGRDLHAVLGALGSPWGRGKGEPRAAVEFEAYWFGCPESIAELRRRLGPMLLGRRKADCLDLPPLRWAERWIAVPERFRRLRPSSFGELATARAELATAKGPGVAEHVSRLLAAGEPKVVVFSEHPSVLAGIRALLPVDVRSVTVDGSTPGARRQTIADAFQQDSGLRVLFGQTQAAGIGLTLTASRRVVFADLAWAPSALLQAAQRCHRIGTSGPVTADVILADGCPLEEHAWALLGEKLRTVDALAEAVRPEDVLAKMRNAP